MSRTLASSEIAKLLKSTGSALAGSSGTDSVNEEGSEGNDEWTDPVVTAKCDFCGYCETPNNCAWSHTCPVCGAPAGKIGEATYCRTPTGGITGLHAERWAA